MASHSRSRSAAAACSIAALLLLLLLPATTTAVLEQQRQPDVEPADGGGYRTYIIQVERPAEGSMDAAAWHHSFLPSTTTALGEPRLQHSYHTVFDGFAARLTEEELKNVSAKPGFLRAFPNLILYPQTTHTPAFLGLPNAMDESPDNWPGVGGRGMITGVVDGGIDDVHPMLRTLSSTGRRTMEGVLPQGHLVHKQADRGQEHRRPSIIDCSALTETSFDHHGIPWPWPFQANN